MGVLMDDAYGIGLAATQVGILHRVLVYRVEPDSPVNALVNPEIEWSSKDKEWAEEGCLSLPAVHVDVERPVHVRVKAQDESGEQILVEASGLEARVIQHEMDHLDGVLILDRTPRDQRKEGMRALRAALEAEATPRTRRRSLVPASSTSAPPRSPPASCATSPTAPHRPALVVTRPDAKQGRGRRLGPPPVAVAARELGIDVDQPASVNDDEARAQIAAVRPDAVDPVRVRRAGQGAAAQRLRHPQRPPVAAAALARRGAGRARDDGRRRPDRRLDHAPRRRARRRPGLRPEARADPADRRLRVAHRAPAGPPARAARRSSLETQPAPEPQPEDGVTYADKLTAEDRTLDLTRAPEENVRIVRALHPHIGARIALPSGDFLGVQEASIDLEGRLELLDRPARRRPADGLLRVPQGPLARGVAPRDLEVARPRRSGPRSGPGSSGRARPR